MPEFMLHHTHAPEDCPKIFEEWKEFDSPLKGKGMTAFCSCPSGDHGSFTLVEADSADAALAMMPELQRQTTKVWGGETMPLDM